MKNKCVVFSEWKWTRIVENMKCMLISSWCVHKFQHICLSLFSHDEILICIVECRVRTSVCTGTWKLMHISAYLCTLCDAVVKCHRILKMRKVLQWPWQFGFRTVLYHFGMPRMLWLVYFYSDFASQRMEWGCVLGHTSNNPHCMPCTYKHVFTRFNRKNLLNVDFLWCPKCVVSIFSVVSSRHNNGSTHFLQIFS